MTDFGKSGGLFGSSDRIREELERVVARLRDGGEKALDAMGIRSGEWQAQADVIETPDAVIVTLNVPGVDSASLDVKIVGNMLTINGTHPTSDMDAHWIVHIKNRPQGEFSHSIPMPIPVNHEEVSAEINDGVLTVRLGKSEAAKSRSIPISQRGE
ncbi:MAG: Hsp20/alpha crystallin family protein [Rhodopirellula sp.]|nr:Hsp20/alpha crystallin family protein [Rhodopirellula sp.]